MLRWTPALLALPACDPAPKETGDTGPAEDRPYEPTWAGMERLFVDHCDRCHPSVNGVDLHTDLQNHTTTPVPGYIPWVTPGVPEESTMWLMVTGQFGLSIMPADGLLPRETVDPMRVWIENGAPFE